MGIVVNGKAVGIQLGAAAKGGHSVQLRRINGQLYYWNAQRREWMPYASGAAHPTRAIRLQGIPFLGATNPSFVAPSSSDVSNNPPQQALADAAVALLAYFSANGVPSEHTDNPSVRSFQTAWNADPLSQINANGTLDVDGGYGPNSHDALASISGGSAPAVNTASAGSTAVAPAAPSTSTSTSTVSSITNYLSSLPTWAKIALGVGAAGGAVVIGKAVAKKHGGRAMGHARRIHGRLKHHAARLHPHRA